jgi:hypothetical protein
MNTINPNQCIELSTFFKGKAREETQIGLIKHWLLFSCLFEVTLNFNIPTAASVLPVRGSVVTMTFESLKYSY